MIPHIPLCIIIYMSSKIQAKHTPQLPRTNPIPPRIFSPPLNIHTHQHRYRTPNHTHQEEKGIADVACCVCYETDDEGA